MKRARHIEMFTYLDHPRFGVCVKVFVFGKDNQIVRSAAYKNISRASIGRVSLVAFRCDRSTPHISDAMIGWTAVAEAAR